MSAAEAARHSWHAFRVTIAMALLATSNSAVKRDELEGVIQTLVRGKTVEALRIYARMKPDHYADFVDLATNKAAGAAPDFGEARFSATLSGFSFHFKSQANADAFDADPWSFAPAWGGF